MDIGRAEGDRLLPGRRTEAPLIRQAAKPMLFAH